MYCVRAVTHDLYWVGANDHRLALFENMHPIPRGVSYNSYLLMDEKTVLFDTVDWSACRQLLENLTHLLGGRTLDYVVVNHLEPDHAACLGELLRRYPQVKVLATAKAHSMMAQFGFSLGDQGECVGEGDKRCFGRHTIGFYTAPMVHWPEVMVSFDETDGILFSADAFGTFGALDGRLFADEVDFERDWLEDARRYYTNIVGKYGPQVQALLKKAAKLDIRMLCPLHGPVWRQNLDYFLDKHHRWSRYEPEEAGALVVYASMYGNTENAVQMLATRLAENGVTNFQLCDVSTTHVSHLVAQAFRYSHLVLAGVTYNLGLYPPLAHFLEEIAALNLQNRTVALIENGSWACRAGGIMAAHLGNMKAMTLLDGQVSLCAAPDDCGGVAIAQLAQTLAQSVVQCTQAMG